MTSHKPGVPIWAALIGSGLAGALVTVQARINGGLSQELGNGYVTAFVSFGVGLVIMCLVMLFSRRGRAGFALIRREVRSGHLPMWALGGGAFGAFYVLTQGLVATVLGLALFTVGIVAGQVLGGLLMDRIGVGPGGRVAPTVPRIAGASLAIVAVVLSVLSDLTNPDGHAATIWLVLVPVLAGLGISFQSAVNGLVRAAAQSTISSTFLNFVTGTSVLLVVAAVSVAVQGWPEAWPTAPWYYTGGAIGCVFIALAAMLVRTAGVLLLSMSNVAGQLVASVAFEAGLPLTGGLTIGLTVGAAVALLAVAIGALPGRKGRGRA